MKNINKFTDGVRLNEVMRNFEERSQFSHFKQWICEIKLLLSSMTENILIVKISFNIFIMRFFKISNKIKL